MDLTNRQIYGIYMKILGHDIDPLDYKMVRNFARSIVKADRELRKQTKCECELKKGPCDVCGLIDGCSVGCER